MDTQVSLLEAAGALKAKERVLILAHPGSGTRHIRDVLAKFFHTQLRRRIWQPKQSGTVAHEVVNPNRPASAYKAVIATRYWDFSEFAAVWHVTRDPARTIYSAAVVYSAQKSALRFKAHLKLAGDEEFELTNNAVHNMMKTLYLLNQRGNRLADAHFRLEDLPPRENPEKYIHVKKVKPLEVLWNDMRTIDKNLAEALYVQALGHGYYT
jgi:hypothetical protein